MRYEQFLNTFMDSRPRRTRKRAQRSANSWKRTSSLSTRRVSTRQVTFVRTRCIPPHSVYHSAEVHCWRLHLRSSADSPSQDFAKEKFLQFISLAVFLEQTFFFSNETQGRSVHGTTDNTY